MSTVVVVVCCMHIYILGCVMLVLKIERFTRVTDISEQVRMDDLLLVGMPPPTKLEYSHAVHQNTFVSLYIY